MPIRVPGAHAPVAAERTEPELRSGAGTGVRPAVAAKANAPLWRPPGMWTFWDRFLFRTGATCVVFGVLAHVLPLVGLQFSKLAPLGAAAPAAGTGVAVVGAFLMVYVLVLKGRIAKLALAMVAVAVLGVAVLLAIGLMSSNRMFRGPSWGNGPYGPGGPGGPMAPGAGPGGPGGPGAGPYGPSGPGFSVPAHPVPPPAIDYASLVARFGAERVARVTLTGVDGVDVNRTVRDRIDAWDVATGGAKPVTWRVTTSGNQAELILAPVGDLDAVVKALDLGAASAMDAAERRVVIEVEKQKAVGSEKK